jgi:hypothetical protein
MKNNMNTVRNIFKSQEEINVLIDISNYDLRNDKRQLIPFTTKMRNKRLSIPKVGLIDCSGNVIVSPTYDIVYGDCSSELDIIVLGRANTNITKSDNNSVKYLFDAFNGYGHCIASSCLSIALSTDKKLISVEKDGHYVLNSQGVIIVPKGVYSWIDGFDHGFARVREGRITNGKIVNDAKWGIIDKNGQEILPLEYDDIWAFYGTETTFIVVEKDGKEERFSYANLNGKRDLSNKEKAKRMYDKPDYDPYGHYNYNAEARKQLSDAYEGESDARWNTD